jgi:transcriptional regulator with XRE-family HTH domain
MQIRTQKGLTQQEISRRTGLAGSYLSRIENRHLEPRPTTLRRIAEALGVPVSEFFQDKPGARPADLQCLITPSGHCVMDLLRASRGKLHRPGVESYNPRQLQVLRMVAYLIQAGDARLLDALELLLGALLNADRKGGLRLAAGPTKSPEEKGL